MGELLENPTVLSRTISSQGFCLYTKSRFNDYPFTGVHSSEWKRPPQLKAGDDIVCSVWEHAGVCKVDKLQKIWYLAIILNCRGDHMMRTCTKCGQMFDDTSRPSMRICKKCNSKRVINSYSVEYKMRNRAQQRAKKRGIECTITLDDIHIPEFCPVLQIPLEAHPGHVGGKINSPTLDRIDNTKGYIPGNVQVISSLANRMKFNGTPEQLITFADWIYKTFKPEQK